MTTLPYREQRIPPELRIPVWLGVAVAASVIAGAAFGIVTGEGTGAWRLARCVYLAAAYAYLVISLADLAEHFRLEREVSGRWLAWKAIPPGETLNHVATVATIGFVLAFGRRPPAALETRDWLTLAAPAIFLGLGWRDEIVYHRRRATHREDLLHTTAHLAAGVMFAGFLTMTLL